MSNTKVTSLTELTSVASGDFLYVVDVSDTTDSSAGSSKKITRNNALGSVLSGLDSTLTSSATELNVLDGVPATLTATELGYSDGVTSAIQTQLDAGSSNLTTHAALTAAHGATGAVVGTTNSQSLSNKTLTAPKFVDLGFIADANGNELVIMDTTTSAVNEITVANAATGNGPTITASGGDTDIDLNLVAKGSGSVTYGGDEIATYTGLYTYPYPNSFNNLYNQALINGSFDVWQRNTTFTTPNDDTYGPDHWNFLVETNGSWTFARDTSTPSNTLAKYSLKCTNVTLNNQCAIVQFIENVDTTKLSNNVVSFSFYAKTNSTEIANLRATILAWSSTADSITSDVISAWASDGTDPTWAANWTAEKAGSNLALTSSWAQFSVESVVLDTASTANLALVIWVDDGTIAANDDFYITGVQMNLGPTAVTTNGSGPVRYGDELARCQRYYFKTFPQGTAPAQSAGATTGAFTQYCQSTTGAIIGGSIHWPVTMFKVPTITTYNPGAANANWRDITNGADRVVTVNTATDGAVSISGASPAAGSRNEIHVTAEAEL